MTTRRMLIEDYELMAHARRAFLGWLTSRVRQGATLDPEEAGARDVLEADTRLEGALFMDWEVRPATDAALVRALEFCRERIAEELAPGGIPERDLPRYRDHRNDAIRRTIARLRGEI